jgi:ABC-type polysaccharide/polyol phosphate transport system ATPase subunit
VSKRRLDKFFRLKSILPNYIYSLTDSADHLLVLEEAQFSWSTGFNVGSISFTGTRSMIIGIAGSVGSGKSTSLLGILGEAIAPQDEQLSIRGIPLKTTIRIRQTTIHEGFAYGKFHD